MQKRLYKEAESYPLTDDSLLFCLWLRAAAEEYLRKGSIKVCAGILFDDRKRFAEYTSGFVGVNLFLSGWVYLWLRKKGVARFSEL